MLQCYVLTCGLSVLPFRRPLEVSARGKCPARPAQRPALIRSNACTGAGSWCNIKLWFPHNSGLFLHTASFKRAKTSWYNCLFTSDHMVLIHDAKCLSNKKNTSKITLTFHRLIRAFFFFRRVDPFLIHCDDCILHLEMFL
jgi:hypothetical protein